MALFAAPDQPDDLAHQLAVEEFRIASAGGMRFHYAALTRSLVAWLEDDTPAMQASLDELKAIDGKPPARSSLFKRPLFPTTAPAPAARSIFD